MKTLTLKLKELEIIFDNKSYTYLGHIGSKDNFLDFLKMKHHAEDIIKIKRNKKSNIMIYMTIEEMKTNIKKLKQLHQY